MIWKSRRLATELLDLGSCKNRWGLVDLPSIRNSRFLMQVFRHAFIVGGIGIIIVAITQTITDAPPLWKLAMRTFTIEILDRLCELHLGLAIWNGKIAWSYSYDDVRKPACGDDSRWHYLHLRIHQGAARRAALTSTPGYLCPSELALARPESGPKPTLERREGDLQPIQGHDRGFCPGPIGIG
jgi:hypothetical protein